MRPVQMLLFPARMWQNHDHVAVKEKQVALVYPGKGCNRLFAHK
jgi:hypothetical protein